MDVRPVIWDARNLRHIQDVHREHGVSSNEVTEALNDPERIESIETRAGTEYHNVVAVTNGGRLMFVGWVDHENGRFPVHARRAGRRLARRYYR